MAVPESTACNVSLASCFSVQQSVIQPACIVTPLTVQGFSAATVLLSNTQQGGSKCSFAICSGRHTSWAGASNIAGAAVLDPRALRARDTIELFVDKLMVSVGVGASWDAVYERLNPLGLSLSGDRAAEVSEFDQCVFFLIYTNHILSDKGLET